MLHWVRVLRGRTIRVTTLLMLIMAAPVRAQRPPLIHIVEPEVWRDGLPAIVPAGRTVRITGLASHPSGIEQVLINGRPAFLRAVPDFPDSFDFEGVVTADSTDVEVVITVLPRESAPFERRFAIQPTAPTSGGLGDSAAVESSVVKPLNPAPEAAPRPSPWRGFALRGAGWAGLLAGGLVLARGTEENTSELCRPVGGAQDCFLVTEISRPRRGLGLGVAGIALAAAITDAILTSRRAGRSNEPAGLEFLRPNVDWEGNRLRLGIVQLTH